MKKLLKDSITAKTILWNYRAVLKYNSRFGMWYMDYDDDSKILVSTDGKRLHISYIDLGIESGGYQVKEDDEFVYVTEIPEYRNGGFPNWRRVVPKPILLSGGIRIPLADCLDDSRLDLFNTVGSIISNSKHGLREVLQFHIDDIITKEMKYVDLFQTDRSVVFSTIYGDVVVMPTDEDVSWNENKLKDYSGYEAVQVNNNYMNIK